MWQALVLGALAAVACEPQIARANGGWGGGIGGGAGGIDSTTGTPAAPSNPTFRTVGAGGGGAGATQGGAGGSAIGTGSGQGGAGGAGAGMSGSAGGAATTNDAGAGGGGGGAAGFYSTVTATTSTAMFGGNGGAGGSGLFGGGGGAGGYGAIVNGGDYTSMESVYAGAGGRGGDGDIATGMGGAGGSGGVGVFMGGAATLDAQYNIHGGAGGTGGAGNAGGAGGDGGAGVVFGADGGTLVMESGSISGGDGGAISGFALPGAGGAGVVGRNLTIIQSANTIVGGLSSNGLTRANAITFTGGVNAFTVWNGWDILGNIDVTGSLTITSHSTTLSNVINGTGSVTVSNAGNSLTLTAANTYGGGTTVQAGALIVANSSGSATGTGNVIVQPDGVLGGTGSMAGNVILNGGEMAPTPGAMLTCGALLWHGGSQIAESIGGSSGTPLAITGEFERGSAGDYTFALTDAGAMPGQTYTLMTFGSSSGFTASDFTVTGITGGQLALTANALTFTISIPPAYGVAMAVAKGKDRATFTVTNTGNTTTNFLLSRLTKIANSYRGPKPAKPGKSPFKIIYTLGGANVTKALESGTTLSLPAGGSAQIVMKVNVRGGRRVHFQRTIRTTLRAISQVDASKSASATVKLVLKPAND